MTLQKEPFWKNTTCQDWAFQFVKDKTFQLLSVPDDGYFNVYLTFQTLMSLVRIKKH